jgi:hypothetical protein
MKRVIEGKTYNTETATLIGEASYGYSGDFNAWDETLYRTPKGAFFLVGSGGARTRWRERVSQNTWCGGEGMQALSAAEALEWCELHDVDVDVISAHFGDLIEEA